MDHYPVIDELLEIINMGYKVTDKIICISQILEKRQYNR
jgi:hypothetical protein